MSKILIHSIAFSPDGVSTAYLYNDIALRFKKEGYDVVVLSTTPHFNVVESEVVKQPLKRRLAGMYSTSNYNGIVIYHVPQKKYKSTILRLIGFVKWHILSFFIGIFQLKVDLIISPSPPLTIGVINIILAKLKRAKVIYNVQEIYPDLLIEEGGLKSMPVIKLLKKTESFVYNHSDAVTTIDEVFYNTIVSRFRDKSKLTVIPNFVDTDIYKPVSLNKNDFSTEIREKILSLPDDKLKVVYAGNIGHAQDWDILLETASKLRESNVEFIVIGEGVLKADLERKITENSFKNIHLLPYQQRELMPQILALSDMQFIFMSPSTEGHGFPSKVYTIMACAKPILISSGKNTPIVRFLNELNCSFIADDQDYSQRVNKMVDFLKSVDKKELDTMGKKGLGVITDNYTKEIVTQQYIQLANQLLS